jgi:hypothetical protein
MNRTATAAFGLLLLSAPAGAAQDAHSNGVARDLSASAAPVPFGVGEAARYRVSYGILGRVGTGTMNVIGIDTVRGHPSYHMHFTLRGGIPGARVNNSFESWMDVSGLFSRGFDQNTQEVGFRRERVRAFFPEERRWTGHTNHNEETGELETAVPFDDTSFLYFVRTLDLEVGREYTFDNYWNPEGNPVRLRVLRRETVRVPAGTFNTIVVQPIIRTRGLFAEGGQAEVYFSEDDARQLVMLRAKVSFGTLTLQLEDYSPGQRLSSRPFVPRETSN